MNPSSLAVSAVSRVLVSDSTVKSLVYDAVNDVDKIYFIQAPSYIEFPYVVITPIGGGRENETHKDGIDMTMRVGCLSDSPADAEELSNAVHDAFNRVLDEQAWEEWRFYAPITQVNVLNDVETIQNFQYYQLGGIYRVRLVSKANI